MVQVVHLCHEECHTARQENEHELQRKLHIPYDNKWSLRHLDVKGCDIAAEVIKLLDTPSYHLTVVVKSFGETAGITEALLHEGIN